jgi:hypothetical protein
MVTVVAVVLRSSGFGLIALMDGPNTVNVTALVVPSGVTTVTFLAPVAAVVPEEIVKVAVTVVSLRTARLLTVTPVPDTLMADAPVR